MVHIFVILQNIYISSKLCSLNFLFYSKNPEKKISGFLLKYEAAQLFSTLIIIRNVS